MKTVDVHTRVALKNILFTTDFSPAADAALPFAIQMARRYGAKLHGVHVRPFDLYAGVPPASWPLWSVNRTARNHCGHQAEIHGVSHAAPRAGPG